MQYSKKQEEKNFNLLKELIATPSPSGFEQLIQSLIKEKIVKYVDDVKVDITGNLIGMRKGKGKLKIALMSHCDETGLMITYISKEGFLYFKPIGGMDEHITQGQRVFIHSKNGPILGVIGSRTADLLSQEERKYVTPFKRQWIDIGADGREGAAKKVSVGDPVTFAYELQRLGDSDIIVSRGLDDKFGVLVLIETLRKISELGEHEVDLYMVSTVQEEIGLRGAVPADLPNKPKGGHHRRHWLDYGYA